MRLACSVSLCLLIFAVSGCRPKETSLNDRDKAYFLLNQRRYPEAIALLSQMITDDPNNDYNRILLSSAYVGALGVNVVDSFAALQPLVSDEDKGKSEVTPDEDLSLAEDAVGTASDRPGLVVAKLEVTVIKLLTSYRLGFRALRHLPYVPPSELPNANEAVLVLSQVRDPAQQNVATLYRAIIRALLSINKLREAIPSMMPQPNAKKMAVLCGIQPYSFASDVTDSIEYLAAGVEDFNKSMLGMDPNFDVEKLKGLHFRLLVAREAVAKQNASLAALQLGVQNYQNGHCE